MPKAPVRVTAVLPPDELERVKYWAASHGISVNEYVRTAVEEAIRRGIAAKPPRHHLARHPSDTPRNMNEIGG